MKVTVAVRTFLTVLILAVFASQAAAVDQVPMSCTFVDLNGTSSGITLSTLPDPVTGAWPIPVPGTSQFRWTYWVTGSFTGINQLVALEPVCSSDMGYTVESGGQVLAPGAGDPTTSYGIGNFQDYAVRLAYSPGSQGLPANYNFLTARAGLRQKSSMQIKIGKAIYYCPNIAGPACYNPKLAVTTQEKIQLNPDNPDAYIIVTSLSDGTVVKVVDNLGVELTWHDLSELGTVDGQPITYLPDRSIMKTGLHSCYSYIYLGRYCQKCY